MTQTPVATMTPPHALETLADFTLDLASLPVPTGKKIGGVPTIIDTRLAYFATLPAGRVLTFQLAGTDDTLRGLKTRVSRGAIRAKLVNYAVHGVEAESAATQGINAGKAFVYIRAIAPADYAAWSKSAAEQLAKKQEKAKTPEAIAQRAADKAARTAAKAAKK
jgi:hypothetical protein